MTFEEWKPEATKQYHNHIELPAIPNFLQWCWNTVSAAERKRWQAEVARLREVLTCAERQTIGHVPEKREHCYICSHVGSEEAIRHDGDCPFAALSTPADSWLSRHDAEVRGEEREKCAEVAIGQAGDFHDEGEIWKWACESVATAIREAANE